LALGRVLPRLSYFLKRKTRILFLVSFDPHLISLEDAPRKAAGACEIRR